MPSAEKPASIFGRAMSDKPQVVLDTNVVLDWLVFRDSRIGPLARRIELGHLGWLACAAMRTELGHMVEHPSLSRWNPDRRHVLAVFDSLACMKPDALTGPRQTLRCSDPDDQIFVDLALFEGASLLYTRDRALLKLRRRARALGLSILAP